MTNAHCVNCRTPIGNRARFQVSHISADERVIASAQLCSLTCLAVWAARYGVAIGRRGIRTFLKALPAKKG